MSWIEPAAIISVHPSVTSDDADRVQSVIDHCQALATLHIGEQATPSAALQAVMVQVVYRFWLATNTDDNISQESIGSYSYTRANIGGLGLTNAEVKLLKKAANVPTLGVISLTRGPLETPPVEYPDDETVEEVFA